MTSPLIRIRSTPRISANKLGEFLAEHKAARRRAILKDQKKELRCRVVQYQAARNAIVASLLNPGRELQILSQHLQRLREWSPDSEASPTAILENRLCREAIESFGEMVPTLDLGGLKRLRGSNQAPKLTKAGVEISVRPELLLHGTVRGRNVVGCVKLHFPKSNPLGLLAAEYVGIILHEFGETHLAHLGSCRSRHCHVIDVSSKASYTSPERYSKRRSDVEAGCQDIATLWPSISVV